MALSSLAQRVATAVLLVPLVLAALFLLPPRGCALVALAIIAFAAHEWSRLAQFGRERAAALVGGVLILALLLLLAPAAGFARGWPDRVVLTVCGVATAFWVLVAPAWLAKPGQRRGWMATLSSGWVVLVAAWVAIVELQARSPWLVLAAMAVVWIADTAAYFTGRKLGRRKLAPTISPNKSWEGVWGGMVAVVLYSLALIPFASEAGYAGSRSAPAAIGLVLFAIVLAAISVVGDLYESMLKRQAGVKDSGSLLPGHGGVLDRIDALLAAMPLAAVAATLFLPKST